MAEQDDQLRQLVAEVAAAYFSNIHVTASEIPTVIGHIASSLTAVGAPAVEERVQAEEAAPAPKLTRAQVQQSIRRDALVSFEDGRSYKTLKRHLAVKSLTPEQYRQKWGLPADYPMVAQSYSEQRKAFARQIGLGRKPQLEVRGGASGNATEPTRPAGGRSAAPTRRGRKPAAAASDGAPKRRGRPPRAAS